MPRPLLTDLIARVVSGEEKMMKIVSLHAESGKTEVLPEASVYGYLCF
jgi:hypothetical protein